MSSIKQNIVANLVGKVGSAIITILLVPIYIKYLGIESYGLVGFYATLIGSMAILDFGLSITLNRELAKHDSAKGDNNKIRNLAFSLECIYWGIGIVICFTVMLLSGFIAQHWVKVEHLSISVVTKAIMLMGAVFAFQWPISLYNGGLTGLEKQVLNNGIIIGMSLLRAAGVIIILKYFSPTIDAFFLWQAGISLLYVIIIRFAFWNKMPTSSLRPIFSRIEITNIWRFAAGMTGISVVSFFLAQIDKIVLSKILPLSQFGYYVLAFTAAASINLFVSPISITFFPRFTNLIAAGKTEDLKILYHNACRFIAAFIFPVFFTLFFFAEDILRIWTRNEVTTKNSYLLTEILAAGCLFNSLMIIPYNLLIASGRTRFTIYQNTIASIILVPMLFLWTHWYGAIGATFVWLTLNAGYVLISQPLMHRILLKGELWRWYWNDTLRPMIPSLVFILCIKYIFIHFLPTVHVGLLLICCVFLGSFALSVFTVPHVRLLIRRTIETMK